MIRADGHTLYIASDKCAGCAGYYSSTEGPLALLLNRLTAVDIGKRFGRRFIFRHVHVEFAAGEVVAITGPNGSGKSTLLRILAGLLTPTEGRIDASWNGSESVDDLTRHVGFVAPYVNVYDSFTAAENLAFLVRLRRLGGGNATIERALREVGLEAAANQEVGTYSSGMKQRLKLAMAVIHDPAVLMFDEPSSNLDAAGRRVVTELIEAHRERGRIVLVATNIDDEAAVCDRQVNVAEFVASIARQAHRRNSDVVKTD